MTLKEILDRMKEIVEAHESGQREEATDEELNEFIESLYEYLGDKGY